MNSISEIIKGMADKTYSHAENDFVLEMQIMGVDAVRQHPVGPYFADFYFPENNLVLELDGAMFHSSDEAKARDEKRDIYMNKLGFPVLRMTGKMAHRNPSGILSVAKYIYRPKTYFINSDDDIKKLMEVISQDPHCQSLAEKFKTK